jgi:hypothetical protein
MFKALKNTAAGTVADSDGIPFLKISQPIFLPDSSAKIFIFFEKI